jgi:uroporphyrinogen decarboxylase
MICEAITEVPITLFAKGAPHSRTLFSKLPCHTIGLDWTMDVAESRKLVGANKTLQGNLDPCALYANNKEIEKAASSMVDAFGVGRHIANLGHGVYPDTDPEKVKVFIETIKEYSAKVAQ